MTRIKCLLTRNQHWWIQAYQGESVEEKNGMSTGMCIPYKDLHDFFNSIDFDSLLGNEFNSEIV